MNETTLIPPDDLKRHLTLARPGEDQTLRHISLVNDTYTILVSGADTAGRYCLIDMLIPPGGGPPPHRHDFEEMFSVLQGTIEVTFRGEKSPVSAGETANIPANAPHSFTNATQETVRLLCLCSPAGQEDYFLEVGTLVATRTSPAPQLNEDEKKAQMEKAVKLAPKYRTELLKP